MPRPIRWPTSGNKLSGLNNEQPTKQAVLYPLHRQHAAATVRLILATALAHNAAGSYLHRTPVNPTPTNTIAMKWPFKFRSKKNKCEGTSLRLPFIPRHLTPRQAPPEASVS
jgi:hypothetical protein